jgi:hypothetical protein
VLECLGAWVKGVPTGSSLLHSPLRPQAWHTLCLWSLVHCLFPSSLRAATFPYIIIHLSFPPTTVHSRVPRSRPANKSCLTHTESSHPLPSALPSSTSPVVVPRDGPTLWQRVSTPRPLIQLSTPANRLAFHIVLRDADGFEGLDSRTFELTLGSKFPIGRASKNTTKKVLMPASHNAYIDSPVISREHALLSAEATSAGPQVFVTDTGSMHGTMVNGERLVAHTAKQLSSGDMLQFGIDVNRNEGTSAPLPLQWLHRADMPSSLEFFVARKYTFEAELARPQAPFSLGFTVPDSDEEEVGSTIPRRGSQSNPLTLDDSDSDSGASDNEHHDVTLAEDGLVGDDEEQPVVTDIHLHSLIDSEHEGSALYYSSDSQDDLDSEASVMGESHVAYDSDLELPDIESEAPSGPDDVAARETDRSLHIYEQTNASYPSRDLFSQSGSWESMPQNPGSELPSMNMLTLPIDPSDLSFNLPPPLPPRPSAARPAIFDRTEVMSTNEFDRYSDEVSTMPTYIGTNHGDRPSLFSPAPASAMASAPDVHEVQALESPDLIYVGPSTSFAPTANRIQTPPLMPASDVMTASTPPPNRRTKVSITEIVEEQPPTPTSVNGTKRKADVLDDAEYPVVPALIATPAGESEHTSEPIVVNTAAQTAAIIAQRPKKQPRSILNKLTTSAKYLGVGAFGAASAVALLSSLPDAFFV